MSGGGVTRMGLCAPPGYLHLPCSRTTSLSTTASPERAPPPRVLVLAVSQSGAVLALVVGPRPESHPEVVDS